MGDPMPGGYARLFGRVAALAVAFGLGLAVTSTGAAYADEPGRAASEVPTGEAFDQDSPLLLARPVGPVQVDTEAPAARFDHVMRLPGALLTVASGLLAVLLTPFVLPGPSASADPPILWAMFAWIRRQYRPHGYDVAVLDPRADSDRERLLPTTDGVALSAHTAGAASTVDLTTGWVTGWVFTEHPDDDRMSYTGSGPTVKGDVIVYEDASFLYKPTAEARRAAAAMGGDHDTFTITVSDGQGHDRAIPITVEVLPA
jgi:hypothetical protein